jgi:glycosyltransferase involved in cell wall biosynthesis
LNQTFVDFELIVIDDGSEPPLEGLCQAFVDSRIVVVRNPVNIGVARSRNIGLDRARGDYVSFLDSDDIYLPLRLESLERLISSMATQPPVVFHCQQRALEPGDGGTRWPNTMPRLGERLDDYILTKGNFIQTNSFVVERSLAQRIRFDIECEIYEDTKFVIECWLASKQYVVLDEVLSVYHDFRLASRLSKQSRFARLLPMMHFTERQCSKRASAAFFALASSELRFFTMPLAVLGNIWRGYRSGVPATRSAVYLLRSMFGMANVDGMIFRCRIAKRSLSKRRKARPNVALAAYTCLLAMAGAVVPQAQMAAEGFQARTPGRDLPRFSNDSFWYQPIPIDAKLNDHSSEYATQFATQVRRYYGHIGLNISDYSAPLYIADRGVPPVRVELWDCWHNGFRHAKLARDFAAVPIPKTAVAAGGTDAELSVYQIETDTLWEFWVTKKINDGWQACWGGRMPNVSTSSGIWQHPYGAAATGLPVFAGQIQVAELQRGEIRHVMGIAVVHAAAGKHSWPANRSDGIDKSPRAIPEGIRLRLDPNVNVDSLNLHPVARAIARAAQIYGFVVWDQAGSISLRLENPKPYTLSGQDDPYKQLFGGTPAYSIMNRFPWDKMQFMPMDYGKP